MKSLNVLLNKIPSQKKALLSFIIISLCILEVLALSGKLNKGCICLHSTFLISVGLFSYFERWLKIRGNKLFCWHRRWGQKIYTWKKFTHLSRQQQVVRQRSATRVALVRSAEQGRVCPGVGHVLGRGAEGLPTDGLRGALGAETPRGARLAAQGRAFHWNNKICSAKKKSLFTNAANNYFCFLHWRQSGIISPTHCVKL